MTRWIKDPEICEGGDIGGDYQLTKSWSARFHREGDARRMVTVYAYGELPMDRWTALDRGDAVDTNEAVVSLMIEKMVCDDPQDPGGTERWSDTIYHLAVYPIEGVMASAGAETYARQIVEDMRDDYLTAHAWDGLTPSERG